MSARLIVQEIEIYDTFGTKLSPVSYNLSNPEAGHEASNCFDNLVSTECRGTLATGDTLQVNMGFQTYSRIVVLPISGDLNPIVTIHAERTGAILWRNVTPSLGRFWFRLFRSV